MIAQLVERHFVGAHHQLPVARPAGLDRHARLEIVQVPGRNDVEADKVDRRHLDRIAFGDLDGEIDLGLIGTEFDIEAGHSRVGIAAIGVERFDALEVGVEPRPVEVSLTSPWNLGALLGRQGSAQTPFVDGVNAVEFQTVDNDGALFPARCDHSHEGNERDNAQPGGHRAPERTITRAIGAQLKNCW